VLVGFPLAKSAPALSTDDVEVLKSFFRIQQIVKRINIAGVLSQTPDAALVDAETSISANINNGGTENKTDAESEGPSETEQTTEDPGQGTTVSLGENKEFLEDGSLTNPTTTMPMETEERTTDPYDYDLPHTAYPIQAEELKILDGETKADSDEDEMLSNSQDADSEEISGRGGFTSGSELTITLKVDSGNTFRIALLALK